MSAAGVRRRWIPAAATGLLVLLSLTGLGLRWYWPPLPRAVDLRVVFAPGELGRSEPLIVSGATGNGDFFFIRYLDRDTAVLGYERWFTSPLLSPAFAVRPGEAHNLHLEVPAFSQVIGGFSPGENRLRIQLDGRVMFDRPVAFQLRRRSHLFFGENPIGGTACGSPFRGRLARLDGRTLRGGVRHLCSWPERLQGWLTEGRWQVFGVIVVSLGCAWLAWGVAALAPGQLGRTLCAARALVSTHRWFFGSALVCLAGFGHLITGGGGPWFHAEPFGNFFDYQAAALLHGRIDVPEISLSEEAFLIDGKFYGYFGLLPAGLRLPWVIFELGFGLLSRVYMLGAFAVALGAAYAVLLAIRRLVTPHPAAPPAWISVVFTLNAGLGSTFLFLGSRAYVYHEASLWGAALALLATVFALRHLARPASRAWLPALALAVLSLHARPTTGLYALVLVAGSALAVAARPWDRRSPLPFAAIRRPLLIAAACGAGVLTFNGVSYLKFGSFGGSPFQYHVQYPAERLARSEGKNFHLANFRHGFDHYLWVPAFTLRRNFPYFYMGGGRSPSYPNAKLDMEEPLTAIPYTMPGLTFLALGGVAAALRFRPRLLIPALVILAALIPMATALFMAIASSHRYTADFCPALIALAALGLAGIERLAPSARRALAAILLPLTAVGILCSSAIALHYQGAVVWGVPEKTMQHYEALRKRVDRFFGVADHAP